MNSPPSKWLFVAVALMIAALGFAIGQGKDGAGMIVVILLSTIWVIYSQLKWGSKLS